MHRTYSTTPKKANEKRVLDVYWYVFQYAFRNGMTQYTQLTKRVVHAVGTTRAKRFCYCKRRQLKMTVICTWCAHNCV